MLLVVLKEIALTLSMLQATPSECAQTEHSKWWCLVRRLSSGVHRVATSIEKRKALDLIPALYEKAQVPK